MAVNKVVQSNGETIIDQYAHCQIYEHIGPAIRIKNKTGSNHHQLSGKGSRFVGQIIEDYCQR